MQNILRNKKLFITLLAGILLVTAAIGAGTYAWFTGGSAAEGSGQFVTSVVDIKADSFKVNSYSFVPNLPAAGSTQTKLENKDLAGFVDFNNLNVGTELIKNAMNKGGVIDVDGWIYSVTLGEVIASEVNFNANDTAWSPVYFRIDASEYFSVFSGLETLPNMVVTLSDYGDLNLATDFAQIGDYYYCKYPIISGYGSQIDVTLQNYIYGGSAANDLQQNKRFDFNTATIKIDVIQATNNAVWFADDWKDAAVNDFFIDYRTIAGIAALFN